MERKLVTIQRIDKIEPIENADAIERATILGWFVVVKKGEFKPGDEVVYFEVDSLLPIQTEFEFLRKSCFNSRLNGFRIKTAKLRGQVSQGIAFPLNILPINRPVLLGEDVTEMLGVTKYEPKIPTCLEGEVIGGMPSFIPKTDEIRIQSVPGVLTRHADVTFIATEKMDGTSSTYFVKDGDFGVVGRNWQYKQDDKNTFWKLVEKYNLESNMKALNRNIAIQGEAVGPGIQKNKYGLKEFELFVYHVFGIDKFSYFSHVEAKKLTEFLGLKFVPEVSTFKLSEKMPTIEAAVEFSNAQSLVNPDTLREGIVVKSVEEKTDPELGRLSFKVISPKFLLKHEASEE